MQFIGLIRSDDKFHLENKKENKSTIINMNETNIINRGIKRKSNIELKENLKDSSEDNLESQLITKKIRIDKELIEKRRRMKEEELLKNMFTPKISTIETVSKISKNKYKIAEEEDSRKIKQLSLQEALTMIKSGIRSTSLDVESDLQLETKSLSESFKENKDAIDLIETKQTFEDLKNLSKNINLNILKLISEKGLFDKHVTQIENYLKVNYGSNKTVCAYSGKNDTYFLANEIKPGILNPDMSVISLSSTTLLRSEFNCHTYNKYNIIHTHEENIISFENVCKLMIDLQNDGIEAVIVLTSDYAEFFIKNLRNLMKNNIEQIDNKLIKCVKELTDIKNQFKLGIYNTSSLIKLTMENKLNNLNNLFILSEATKCMSGTPEEKLFSDKIFEAMKNTGTQNPIESKVISDVKSEHKDELTRHIVNALNQHVFYPKTRGLIFVMESNAIRKDLEKSLRGSSIKLLK